MPDIFIDHSPHPKQPHHIEKPSTEKKAPESRIEKRIARHHKLGVFSSFVRDPLGVALAEQHEDEHILLFIRRAFVTNVPWLVFSAFLLIVPFLLPPLLAPLNLPGDFLSPAAMGILIIFYYIIVLGVVLTHFLTWFYDIGIVTEKRAVDIDFYNISFVSVATARAQDLKDVRYAQKGFFESLFDYGDVTMVVEASGEVLTFENTRHPAEVVSMLSVLIGGHQE
jgi:hypothetical protein